MTPLIDTPAVATRPAGIVRVSGHDRLAYLHSLLSQHVEDLRPGQCADFLYLDHKANPLAEGRVLVRAGDVLLVVDPVLAAPLAEALARFTFLLDATAETVDDWSIASVRGPGEIRVPGLRGERMTMAPHGSGLVVHDRSGGADLVGPTAWVEERVAELGLALADADDWTAWRIANGVPAWGSEVAGGHRPQELGLLPTHVHLKKGCYPGQETIAKTWNLGRPRRALAVVDFDGPVAAGAAVDAAGRPGTVTSAAPVDGGTVALALLPVDRDGSVPAVVSAVDAKGADVGGGDVGGGDVGGAKGTVRRRVGEGLAPPGA